MPLQQVRLYGDPLSSRPESRQLRATLQRLHDGDWQVALCVTPVQGDPEGRLVQLTDGRADLELRTLLADAELSPVLGAIASEVSATAPILVFGSELLRRQAELEFPAAVVVWSGLAAPDVVVELSRYLAATPCRPAASSSVAADGTADGAGGPRGPLIHVVHDGDAERSGLDALLEAYGRLRQTAARSCPELWVFGVESGVMPTGLPGLRYSSGLPATEQLQRAAGLVQPLRAVAAADSGLLQQAMSLGVPLLASSFAGTNQILDEPGIYLQVGGRLVDSATQLPGEPGVRFEPDRRALLFQLTRLVGEFQADMVEHARRFVRRRYTLPSYPRSPVPRPRCRPRLVLEAPIFETSSSSVLTLETARALLGRGRVEVLLRPTTPFENGLEEFQRDYPELVPQLCREPEDVDLWLSAGWPVRRARPAARRFAIRLDWEYGALPVALAPAVTQEADTVVVHSRHVHRSCVNSGAELGRLLRIPHGVDAQVFRPSAPALPEVTQFKGRRRALLFVGGLIWRKGFDLLIKALLDDFCREDPICLVIKPLGSETSYHGHNLGGLIDRVRQFANAPEVLLVDRHLSRAELAGLYTACDLLVHPYRGEGFCMPVLEARACGLPVLVTEGGSTDDFCQGQSSVRIPSCRRQIALPEPHLGQPFVLEPDYPSLRALLGQMLPHLDALRRLAGQEAAAVAQEFSWQRAAEQLEHLAHAAAVQTPARPAELLTGIAAVARLSGRSCYSDQA